MGISLIIFKSSHFYVIIKVMISELEEYNYIGGRSFKGKVFILCITSNPLKNTKATAVSKKQTTSHLLFEDSFLS